MKWVFPKDSLCPPDDEDDDDSLLDNLWISTLRRIILVAGLIFMLVMANKMGCDISCPVHFGTDRSREAVQQRIDQLDDRLIRDDAGNIIGIRR